MKQCTGCRQMKPLEEYSPNKNTRDGVQSQCKACAREARAQWRAENPSRAKAERDVYKAANPGYFRDHYAKNRTREAERKANAYRDDPAVRERLRRYDAANPHVRTAITAKRRASLVLAVPAWADGSAIKRVYESAREMTDATGVIHEVDHIVPLQGKTVCGLHCEANLCVLPLEQNRSKSNRVWPGMP